MILPPSAGFRDDQQEPLGVPQHVFAKAAEDV